MPSGIHSQETLRELSAIASHPPLDNVLFGRVRRHALLFPTQFWLLVGGTYLYLVGYEIGYPFETIYLHSRSASR